MLLDVWKALAKQIEDCWTVNVTAFLNMILIPQFSFWSNFILQLGSVVHFVQRHVTQGFSCSNYTERRKEIFCENSNFFVHGSIYIICWTFYQNCKFMPYLWENVVPLFCSPNLFLTSDTHLLYSTLFSLWK